MTLNRLWKQVVSSKYNIHRNGWLIWESLPRFSVLWKGILDARELFLNQIKFRVGKGDKIFFWKDLWVGETTLVTTLPDLFLCSSNQDARVEDYMERRGDSILWGPIFR